MKVEWSRDNTLKIWGDYSPHPIVVTKEVYNYYFDEDEDFTFHEINRLRKQGFLPRVNSSECNPFNKIDIRLAKANEFLKCRFWVYGTLYPTAHEYVRGYYKRDGNDAVFFGGTIVKDYFE